ncbi:MAG TPA: M28 family peptidase [Bacteroidales bacterium]|nr:M28 family peptidase [Bacteroidales bacterium]
MKHRYFIITGLFLVSFTCTQAQDTTYYKEVIRELSSKKYEGRSDFSNGDRKAAKYIARQFRQIPGVEPSVDGGYLQPFTYNVNVFHKKMEMSVDGIVLEPGKDFIVREFSPSQKGTWPLKYINPEDHDPERLLPILESGDFRDSYVVLQYDLVFKYMGIAPFELYKTPIAGLIMVQDKVPSFFKSRSGTVQPIPVIWAGPGFPDDAKQIQVRFESRMIEGYTSSNVIAHIPGTSRADSCIVFIAHYDHLGHFGKEVYYPGAHDNASGVAFILTLAHYYALPENRPELTYVFIAVAAEENNLLGSTYYTNHPVVPLDRTLQVIDPDMVADNGERLFLETGPGGEETLQRFKHINDSLGLFTIEQRPLSNDSDHYPFAMKKVPALYMMVDGDAFDVYHTPLDDYHHIYTNRYLSLFRLVTAFASTF